MEFLFNILMENKIAFLSNKEKNMFILLDYKLCVSTIEINDQLKTSLKNNKFDFYIFSDGKINGKWLSKMLQIASIEKYKEIFI